MTVMWSNTLWDLLKLLVVFFLSAICIQTLVSLLISQILYYSNSPIKGISFRIWGPSISAFKLTTICFKLKINKIHISWARRFIITLQDVDVELLKRQAKGEETKESSTGGSSTNGGFSFENEKIQFTVGKRLLAIIRWVLPLRLYIRNVIIVLPSGVGVKVDLVSSAITEFSEKRINAEVFVHAAKCLESGDTVHHIGYQFKAKVRDEIGANGGKTVVTIRNWLSYLRVAGVCISLPDLLARDLNRSGSEPIKAEKSPVQLETMLREKLDKFKAPLKAMKVLDFKMENIFFIYEGIAQVTISNAQMLLESVHFYSYGTNLEFLPSKSPVLNDHQLSVTANSIVIEFKEISSVRIPLFNAIITTDCVSRLFMGVPLSDAKILTNVNIINPTMVVTMAHVLKIASLIRNYKASKAERLATRQVDAEDDIGDEEYHDVASSEEENIKMLREAAIHELKQKFSVYPNAIIEFTISNLSATLQLSEKENILFKLYNAHCLGFHQNDKKVFVTGSSFNDVSSRPELQYFEGDPFTQQLYNYLQVIGAKLTFLKLPSDEREPALSVPICGFDRSDTFMDDISDFDFRVRSTLRHFSFTLDSLDILHKITEAMVKLFAPNGGNEKSGYQNSYSPREVKGRSFVFAWSVKLRLKDFSFSLLLAGFLPRYLDPVEYEGINLTDLGRGTILLMNEALLKIDPEEKDFKISSMSLIRIMEHGHGRKITDVVFGFEKLVMSWKSDHNGRIHLPCIRFKLDPNILWSVFFIKKVFDSYLLPFKKAKHSLQKKHPENQQKKFDVRIGKIIVDLTLPQDTVLLLSFRDIILAAEDHSIRVASITAFVKSVYVKVVDVHVPLLIIREFEFKVMESAGKKTFDLSTSLIQFDTEYHFKFYTLLDNAISFVKCIKQMKLAFSNLDKFHRLYPSQEPPRELPTIRLFAKRFGIKVKEDPFEQELGLIFKVGVLEQRERLEKLREFEILKDTFVPPVEVPPSSAEVQPLEQVVENENVYCENEINENQWIKNARKRLLENFSTSWIARYREARMTFLGLPSRIVKHQELGRTYFFFTVNEGTTVAELAINNLDFNVGPPSFSLPQYADFIYKYGKKVPKDTAYTLLIIAHLSIRTDLWELRARDYPLPAISFPNTFTNGDVVFGEKMPDECSLRSVYVPFVPSANTDVYSATNTIYGTHIIRTLNSIKSYFNITTSVHSAVPATLTWGKSLQPGYESLMLWFDVLTRPKEDPSPKLGFWDKCRFLFHGKWIYDFSDISGIQLNIKGSENPYKIADDGAGLTFFWSGGTFLRIHGTSDPTEFLKIESKKFQLAVRDFTEHNKFEKVFSSLEGEVIWTLGLLFEEGNIHDPGDFPRSPPSRPHFDVISKNPKAVSNPEEYDAFRGFRTAFIHMSLGVYSSKKNSSNSIYLAPHGVAHFLKWWSLFHTYTSGPIRQGPLFSSAQPNKAKFGRSLFTVKYQLCLEPLVLTHVYRHYSDFRGNGSVNFTGLKCRVNSLEIDLHQKRIKLLHTNEKLKKSKAIWSFKMSTGQIECAEADVRILSTVFDQSDVEKMAATKLGKHVKSEYSDRSRSQSPVREELQEHSEWYDYEDYIDLDQVSLETSPPLRLEAVPLMYFPRLSYFRQINDSGYIVKYPFGDEESHHCIMGKDHSERTQEHLARSRGKEIEEDIQRLTDELEVMKKQHGKSQTYHTQYENLTQKLHEAKHRLFVIESILTDLKLSADVPNSFHGDEEGEASIMSSTGKSTGGKVSEADDVGPYDDTALLRIGTIETFRTMRCESNVNLASSYDNRFFVHNVQFKVNKKVRHHLIDYFTSAFERKSMQFFLTYKSVTILNELLNAVMASTPKPSTSQEDTPDSGPELSNAEFMERFDDLVREVPSGIFDYIDSYLIRLISPQLQLMSESEPNVAALITARDIEVGIINIIQFMDDAGARVPMDLNTLVEARLCVVSKDIQVFTLMKNDILAKGGEGFHRNGYGVEDKAKLWPPWIPMEVCFEGSLLEEDVFVRRRSMYFMHTIPNPLFFSDKEIPGLSGNPSSRLGFPGLLITSTSQQYCAVYNIVEDLLDFGDSLDDKVAKLANVMLAEEVKYNLKKLDTSIVTNLQRKVKEQYYTREFLKLHSVNTFKKTAPVLTLQIQTTMLELFIIMTAIKKNYDDLVRGHKTGKRRHEWRVSSDELIWEMFDDSRKPFITIALGSSIYVRHEAIDGTNSNLVALSSVKCFNQQENPVYVEIVAPFDKDSHYSKNVPMVQISWNLGPPVGGIGDLQKMVVTLQPFKFKIDHITSDKIMNYLFPKSDRQAPAAVTSSTALSPSSSRQPAMATVINPQGGRRSRSSTLELSASFSNSSEDADGEDLSSVQSGSDLSSMRKKASRKIATHLFSQPDKNISEMVKRSSTYFNVGYVHINKLIMSVCYKGAHHLLTDVNNLTVRVPHLEYKHKLWSREEFIAALRRDITRVVLGHLGNIIGNKFIPHKKENKHKVSMDISQLLHLDGKGSGSPRHPNRQISHSPSVPSWEGDVESLGVTTDEEIGLGPFNPAED